ncbi:MAG: 50S ribosomal protein L17 [Nitrospinota bacterium]|jgi:large subunit ribosomal protein L17|nr:50S ribosomal protein L17 [Nitrospinota bacterium]MDH5789888.1 50S ribosomal protein L17 [Nitrospinota bacterium]
MRHLKSGRKLGRTTAHRKALFRNMVTALIRRERIRTTLAKAKELRSHVEKTITLGKKGTLHAKRLARKVVVEKEAFTKLFSTLSERYAKRSGGYTRIIKIGNRRGDDAPMAFIELVDGESKEPETKAKVEKKAAPKKAAAKKPEKKAESKPEKEKKAVKKTETKKPAEAKKETKKAAPKKEAAKKTAKAASKKAAPKKK